MSEEVDNELPFAPVREILNFDGQIVTKRAQVGYAAGSGNGLCKRFAAIVANTAVSLPRIGFNLLYS